MSSIGEGCDGLGTMSLSSFGGDHWATGGLRVNPTSVKGGLIRFPLFLLEGNAILPMTRKAGCVMVVKLKKIVNFDAFNNIACCVEVIFYERKIIFPENILKKPNVKAYNLTQLN